MDARIDECDDGYAAEVPCRAPRERVFAAVATVAGLRGWWTPIVAGTAVPDGELHLGFEGLDEEIVLRVDAVTPPAQVRWTCLRHTGDPAWADTTLAFDVSESGDGCVLAVRHIGLPANRVAAGWQHFLASVVSLVEHGAGTPYTASADALRVARAYHRAWTGKDFAAAARFLAPDLATDVPLNTYPTRADFVTALTGFGALVRRVDLLAEFGSGAQALLLYDMHTDDFGTIRIAEQFTVAEGLIRRIRHVHDTAALRAAA